MNSEEKKYIPKGGLCTISFESNGSFSAIGFSMVVSVFFFSLSVLFLFYVFWLFFVKEAINQGRNGWSAALWCACAFLIWKPFIAYVFIFKTESYCCLNRIALRLRLRLSLCLRFIKNWKLATNLFYIRIGLVYAIHIYYMIQHYMIKPNMIRDTYTKGIHNKKNYF